MAKNRSGRAFPAFQLRQFALEPFVTLIERGVYFVLVLSLLAAAVNAVVLLAGARWAGVSAPRAAGGLAGLVGQPAILAFALSFDEIIVTTFTAGQQQTLPIWIFSQLFRPRERPVTNVVAILVVLVMALPILYTHRLTQRADDTMGSSN